MLAITQNGTISVNHRRLRSIAAGEKKRRLLQVLEPIRIEQLPSNNSKVRKPSLSLPSSLSSPKSSILAECTNPPIRPTHKPAALTKTAFCFLAPRTTDSLLCHTPSKACASCARKNLDLNRPLTGYGPPSID